jgi:hypothetical protein
MINNKRNIQKNENEITYDFSNNSIDNNNNNNNNDTEEPSIIHIEQEYKLSKCITNLHNSYEHKFKDLFQIKYAPKDSLNRFLYEQLSLSHKNYLIIISSPENILKLDTLDKEIRTAYPLTCRFNMNTPKWKLIKNLKDCIYIGKQLCKKSRIFISNKELQDLLNNKQKHLDDNNLDFNKFQQVRNEFCSKFKKEIDHNIYKIKLYLYEEIKRNELDSKISNLIIDNNNSKDEVTIDYTNNESFNIVSYKDKKFKLNKFHFEKLKNLFHINKHRFNEQIRFEERYL